MGSPIGTGGSSRSADRAASISPITALASLGVMVPSATAASTAPVARAASPIPLIAGNSRQMVRSFRGGTKRSMHIRSAVVSPAKPSSMAFRVKASASPSSRASAATVLRLRAPFGLAEQSFGVRQHWHKRIVRAGPNTVRIFAENPPVHEIAQNDTVFLDLGPVFDEWEADVGRTYVMGNDPQKTQLCLDLPKVFDALKQYYDSHPEVTGAELYSYAHQCAEASGWLFGGVIAGHIVGEFPHALLPGDKDLYRISPANIEPMRSPDALGQTRFWILEVHLVDRTVAGVASTSGVWCRPIHPRVTGSAEECRPPPTYPSSSVAPSPSTTEPPARSWNKRSQTCNPAWLSFARREEVVIATKVLVACSPDRMALACLAEQSWAKSM
jgi:Xaa-Pro dipeptidase